ncbi:Retrovirus-related Pol polyprotein from transposon [Trichinella sp. T9]|nr:Retrovirus-related Pol polyprotein from transposon [Trichinella sp. T9]
MISIGCVLKDREAAVAHCPQIWRPQKSSAQVSMWKAVREYTRPVMEIYDELASNASTSLETAVHFLMWDQTRYTMYNRRAWKYPLLPATREVFLVCACADQQPSGRLAQPHDKKSTKAPPGQMDDDYTRERGFVRCSAAYRFPQRWEVRQRLREYRCSLTSATGRRRGVEVDRRLPVDVDASGDGLGAVLSQKDGSKERVVAYASRSLTKPERRYCVTRREMLRLVCALREFRPYLYGQRVLVRTDHSCLRWLRNFKEPEGQDAFMAMLTRCHGPVAFSAGADEEQDQLLTVQQADPEIQLLRQWVTSGSWPTLCSHEYCRDLNMTWQQGPIWIVQEDLICRHRDVLTANEGATQVLVPRALRNPLQDQKPILLARDEWGRTLMVPHEHAVCGEKRAIKKQPRTDAANDCGYSAAASGNGHLGATGKDPVWQLICPGLDGLLYQELSYVFDIDKTRSSPYHPQGNGQAERFNRTLLDMLSIMCEENRQQWDEMLSFAMLAYNSSVNESTGVTPAIAMFGRELQLPLDIQMEWPQRKDTETLPNYIRQTRERIDIVHEQMRRQLTVQQRRQKSLYDRKATQGTFRVMDLVWLAILREGKLHPCWEGPCEIVQTLGSPTHRVRHQERRRRNTVVHSDRLKKYVTREDANETRRRPYPLGTVLETT